MRNTSHERAKLVTCPCCGSARSASKIPVCRNCEWHDDGSDNAHACFYSAANETNLNLARYRFLKAGRNKLPRRRNFRIDESGGFVEELGENGKIIYRGPIPFVDYAAHGKGFAAIPLRRRATKSS